MRSINEILKDLEKRLAGKKVEKEKVNHLLVKSTNPVNK